MNDLLNPSQKTSPSTVLRMFEEDLRQADAWLDGRQTEGILYQRELHLSTARRTVARQRIAAGLDEIAALAQEIGLEPEIEDPAWFDPRPDEHRLG